GNGNGTFVAATHFTAVTTGTNPIALGIADFDNDNKQDLIVVDSAGVNVLKGNGDDTFNAPVRVLTQSNLTGITVGIFGNVDANPDFAVTSSTTVKDTVDLNAGALAFSSASFQVNGAGNTAIINQSAIIDGKMNTGD